LEKYSTLSLALEESLIEKYFYYSPQVPGTLLFINLLGAGLFIPTSSTYLIKAIAVHSNTQICIAHISMTQVSQHKQKLTTIT
jgi:hypothetical protein